MMPKERAARIVWRLLAPEHSWEQYERRLVNQRHPEWNHAVAFVADEICQVIWETQNDDLRWAEWPGAEQEILFDALDEVGGDLDALEPALQRRLEVADGGFTR